MLARPPSLARCFLYYSAHSLTAPHAWRVHFAAFAGGFLTLSRMREELTRCSPEKKSEGLLAGLAKWTKDKGDWKGDSANDAAGGLDGSEGRTRVPSWIGSWDSQVSSKLSSWDRCFVPMRPCVVPAKQVAHRVRVVSDDLRRLPQKIMR